MTSYSAERPTRPSRPVSPTLASGDDPTAKKLNSATKYVVTSTLAELNWNKSERVAGDVTVAVAGLKARDGPLLQVHGSWQLAQTLLANDLVDEFRLWVFPVVVGSGKRLFGRGTATKALTLLRTSSTANGAVMSIYRRE
jgi:dihydrofolate reductase